MKNKTLKNRLIAGASLLGTCLLLAACCIRHDWEDATCTTPKTCSKCGETEGTSLGHDWQEATCSAPKTCSTCGEERGDTLEHDWEDATCNTPKTCNLCGETEGGLLEHDLTAANYQEPGICTMCNEAFGDPLEPTQLGIGAPVELDVVYNLAVPCYENDDVNTVAKVVFTNHRAFESDDTHAAKEGYEWQTLECTSVFGDENGWDYGYTINRWFCDYYSHKDVRNTYDGYTFTVNYNGKDYTGCRMMIDIDQSDWEKVEQYGWSNTVTIKYNISVLMPKDADGFIWGLFNKDYQDEIGDADWDELTGSEYLYYRFDPSKASRDTF